MCISEALNTLLMLTSGRNLLVSFFWGGGAGQRRIILKGLEYILYVKKSGNFFNNITLSQDRYCES